MAAEAALVTPQAVAEAAAEQQQEQAQRAQRAEPVGLPLLRGARQAPQRLTTLAAVAALLRLAAALTLAEAVAVAASLALPEWAAILIFLLVGVAEPLRLGAEQVPQPLAWQT
jgi:hypothetical protein